MIPSRATEMFHRYGNNPIISVKDLSYPANTVFNAGATKIDQETVLLMRVEDKRGSSHLTADRGNGTDNWKIDFGPTLLPEPKNYPEEIYGIEAPRITYVEEKKLWTITYTAYSKAGPLVSLATTSDFRSFERQGSVMPPEDKDAALFPVRFAGRWAMIHRPVPAMPSTGAHIWISFSPDLKHWGDHRFIID